MTSVHWTVKEDRGNQAKWNERQDIRKQTCWQYAKLHSHMYSCTPDSKERSSTGMDFPQRRPQFCFLQVESTTRPRYPSNITTRQHINQPTCTYAFKPESTPKNSHALCYLARIPWMSWLWSWELKRFLRALPDRKSLYDVRHKRILGLFINMFLLNKNTKPIPIYLCLFDGVLRILFER